MLSGLSFRSAFVFSISSLISSRLLTSFHLAEADLVPRVILKNPKPYFCLPLTMKKCAGVKVALKPQFLLFRGLIFLCVQLSKNITKCFLFITIHILVLILQSACFVCTSWKHKQTMEQQSHRASERTKSKQKKSKNKVTSHSNWPHVLIFDLVHTQCNGIIKGWLDCLTSESKERFLINNIL